MDMEWAKDGIDGEIYIVQARPETVASQKKPGILEEYTLKGSGKVLAKGRAVGAKIGSGKARVIHNLAQLSEFQPGEVLVADITTPDWGTVMKTAAGDRHQSWRAHLSRGYRRTRTGDPGHRRQRLGHAGDRLRGGDHRLLRAGDLGIVYDGAVPFEVRQTDLHTLARPQTRIMINVGNPDIAFRTSFLPNDGVGLARMEFIITESIKAHPMALLHPDKVDDPREREALERLAASYPAPPSFSSSGSPKAWERSLRPSIPSQSWYACPTSRLTSMRASWVAAGSSQSRPIQCSVSAARRAIRTRPMPKVLRWNARR